MHFTNFFFNLINGLAYKNEMLDSIMIASSKSIPLILVCSTIAVYLFGILKKNSEYRSIAVSTVIKTVISYAISQLIGTLYPLPRPFVNDPNANLLYSRSANSSFPSDHALGGMSVALGINKLNNLYGKLNIFLALLVGFSRVYVGHHYPLDVLGGYLIAYIIGKLYDKFLYNQIDKIYFYVEKYVPVLNMIVKEA